MHTLQPEGEDPHAPAPQPILQPLPSRGRTQPARPRLKRNQAFPPRSRLHLAMRTPISGQTLYTLRCQCRTQVFTTQHMGHAYQQQRQLRISKITIRCPGCRIAGDVDTLKCGRCKMRIPVRTCFTPRIQAPPMPPPRITSDSSKP